MLISPLKSSHKSPTSHGVTATSLSGLAFNQVKEIRVSSAACVDSFFDLTMGVNPFKGIKFFIKVVCQGQTANKQRDCCKLTDNRSFC